MKAAVLMAILALSVRADTWYFTVAGLGGEPEYEQRFNAWAQDLEKIVKGGAGAHVETLAGAAATSEAVRAALARIARGASPQDSLVAMFIGHGSFDGTEYKLNLPGPDLAASELAVLLDRVPAEHQLVVNMTSASGGSLAAFKRHGRVVITATRSGTEKNATIFARCWVEALRDPAADTDKNEVITASEAFQFASRKVTEFYESQKRLATEHPVLDAEGAGGAQFAVVRFGAAQRVALDPSKRKLMAHREDLEQQIDRLKYQKAALPEPEYRKQLTALLLDLARTQVELDK
jgi:hypothetical protein